MKIRTWIITIFVIFIGAPKGYPEVIRVAVGDYAPYTHRKELKHMGIASHIVEEVFQLEGLKVKWGWFPWKRAFSEVKHGDWDASPLWTIQDDRKQYFYFTDPLIEGGISVFFYLNGFSF